jgi:hypothetical protein
MCGLDPFRSGSPDGLAPTAAAKVLWRFRADFATEYYGSPAVAGGRVYIGDNGGVVYCLDAETGRQVWRFRARKAVFSAPVVVGGRVYVGEGLHTDDDCRMHCLDAATGRLIWAFRTEGHCEGSALVDAAAGRLWFGAGGDGVYCLNLADGKKVWHRPGPHLDTGPVLVGGRLVFGTGYDGPGVYALDAATGKPAWNSPVDIAAWSAPAVRGNRVIIGTGQVRYGERITSKPADIRCLDSATGKLVWIAPTPAAVMAAVCCPAGGDTAYAAAADGTVLALESDTGRVRWTAKVGQGVMAGPVWLGAGSADGPNDGGLLITGVAGTVFLLDPADGAVRRNWVLARDNGSFREGFMSTPAVVGGRVFLGGLDGRVWCLGTPPAADPPKRR